MPWKNPPVEHRIQRQAQVTKKSFQKQGSRAHQNLTSEGTHIQAGYSLIMADTLRQEYKGGRKLKKGGLEQKTWKRETQEKSENIVLGIRKFRSNFRKGNFAIW